MIMAVSSGEPRLLLNALDPMLGLSGDIKTPQEVVQIISLMHDADKLMSRCVYMNILTATIEMAKEEENSSEILDKFILAGGWDILNKWLADAKKSEDFHIMLEVLKVLRELPVSVDTLKQGTIGKIVKQLSKSEHEEIRKISTSILRQWMSLVRNKSGQEKTKQNGAPAALHGANSVPSPSDGKPGKRARDNQSSPQPEKKAKTLTDVKSSISQKPVAKTKVIPPQPKPAAMESTGFMNALASAAAPAPARKRKRVVTAAGKTSTTSTTSASNSSATTKTTYTGILDEIMNSQSQTHGLDDREKDHTSKEDSANKKQQSPDDSPQQSSGNSAESGNDKDQDPDKENSSTAGKDSESVAVSSDTDSEKPAKKSKKGKSVTWASDDKINTYHFFEMDEDERALVRHPVNFTDAQHMEMKRERELVEQAKRLNEDRMIEKVKWYRPRLIERRTKLETGSKSEQKLIQSDRESSILADLFLTKSSLPDSAAEPDAEVEKVERGEPKVIPHDEKGTTHMPEKASPVSASGVQLPAALASLFSAGGANKPGPTQSPTQDAQRSVQNLLDQLMKPSSGPGQAANPLTQLLNAQKQQQQQAQPQDPAGPVLPSALQQILEPLRSKAAGPPPPRGPGPTPGQGLLGAAPPGHPPGPMNMRHPGMQFGPRGMGNRPDGPMRFLGPGGPRQGHPMGPHFPGPDGMGPRHRGPMMMRMQRPPGPGRGAPNGPRPLLPELSNQQEEKFDEPGELGEQEEGEFHDNGAPHMRGRGRGMPRGRGRGRGRGMPLCRHFASRRGCLRGNTCHFLHPGINGPPL